MVNLGDGSEREFVMRRVRWWRYAGMLAGSGVLLQVAGCNLDQATIGTLLSTIAPMVIQALLSTI